MPRYFHFDVTLVLSRRVWRSFLIHKQASFHELHLAIQDAFGWQNYHLFQFQHPADSRRVIAGIPDDEFGEYIPDAKRVKLVDKTFSSSVPVWFEYEYDFGDGWRHEVKLRGDVSLPDKFKRRLLDGERAAPPEDAGGESGYDRLLTVFEKTSTRTTTTSRMSKVGWGTGIQTGSISQRRKRASISA